MNGRRWNFLIRPLIGAKRRSAAVPIEGRASQLSLHPRISLQILSNKTAQSMRREVKGIGRWENDGLHIDP
jgi:hypothetical protein